MYTVLSEKKALISEERVKNLTDAQWIFHYAEIRYKNKKDNKERADIINIILDRIEMMICNGAVFSRTDLKYEKIKEVIDKIRDQHNENRAKRTGDKSHKQTVRDSMMEAYNEIKDIAPTVLDVEDIDEEAAMLPRMKAPKKGRRRNGKR